MKLITHKNKRASLELSINAIVILVMAMVVLGLGLGFVRGLFGQGQQNLVKVIDNNMLENQATYDTPFTIDRNVKVKLGKAAPIYLGVFNKGSGPATFNINIGGCKDQMGSPITYVALAFPTSLNVPDNEAQGARGSVYVDDAAGGQAGGYICEVSVNDGAGTVYSSSVFIEASGG